MNHDFRLLISDFTINDMRESKEAHKIGGKSQERAGIISIRRIPYSGKPEREEGGNCPEEEKIRVISTAQLCHYWL